MTDKADEAFPDRLRIRDTRLYDDMGGAGQRIYTTAGQGYTKVEYIRADLHDAQAAEVERLKDSMREIRDELGKIAPAHFKKAAKAQEMAAEKAYYIADNVLLKEQQLWVTTLSIGAPPL